MPLIVINKLGEDGRGRDHEFKIAIDDWTQLKKLTWIIGSIDSIE